MRGGHREPSSFGEGTRGRHGGTFVHSVESALFVGEASSLACVDGSTLLLLCCWRYNLRATSIAILRLLATSTEAEIIATKRLIRLSKLDLSAFANITNDNDLLIQINGILATLRVALLTACQFNYVHYLAQRLVLTRQGLNARGRTRHLIIRLIRRNIRRFRALRFRSRRQIFLLMTNVLGKVLRFIRDARILFPDLVSNIRSSDFFGHFRSKATFYIMNLLRRIRSTVGAAAINSERQRRNLIDGLRVLLMDTFSSQRNCKDRRFNLLFRTNRNDLRDLLTRIVALRVRRFLLNGKGFRHRGLGRAFLAACVVIVLGSISAAIPGRVNSIRASALTRRDVAALLVGRNALLIRRIVMLRRAFAGAGIILLRLLLNALGNFAGRLVLGRLAVLGTRAVRRLNGAFINRRARRFIFRQGGRSQEAKIALAANAATRLTIRAATFVTLHASSNRASHFLRLVTRLSINAAANRINDSNRHATLAYLNRGVNLLLVRLNVRCVI